MKLVNLTRGSVLAETVAVAETPGSRRSGLLGTDSLPGSRGLLIVPCRHVHTFGMRYPIDLVFIDEAWKVKRVVHGIKPGRLSPVVLGSRAVLEIAAGRARDSGTGEGDLLDALPAD
ncbi:MAG: DUF192 domain-containing protein [Actinomycetota bacterium]|nr:DUF192 domain-containing protein [Actinomycetota bacterium]